MENWGFLQEHLNKTVNIIFDGYNINKLSFYEKRKLIFKYLINNINYDYALLEQIKNFKINGSKVIRNAVNELYSVINNKVGICNAISQYYKLLLEMVGINAYCIICDDGTQVKHQLNLIYDKDNDSYSFDDVTSVIVGRGTMDDFFDYDLQFANSVNQGNKFIIRDQSFIILPEDYINNLVNRKISLSGNMESLPDNIVSLKTKSKIK